MPADYTPKQGQYLAFIYYYTKINRVPPAEIDMQRFFQTTPPAVHEMVKTLHSRGFITREPGKAQNHPSSAAQRPVARLGMMVRTHPRATE